MKDDKGMIPQMRIVYVKSNKLLRIFNHCTTDVKLVLFDSYCTSLYCQFHFFGLITLNAHLANLVAFNNPYRIIFNCWIVIYDKSPVWVGEYLNPIIFLYPMG